MTILQVPGVVRRRLGVLGLLTLATALLAACSPPPEVVEEQQKSQASARQPNREVLKDVPVSPFVSVHGNKFYLQGKPYRFVGANMWYAAYLGSTSDDIGDRERLKRELDLLKANGVTNLRILGASERSPMRDAIRPAISSKAEVERPDILEGLDFALAEMAKRDMKAVIFLNNFWEWSGGMATYLSWVNGGEIVDMADPDKPWPAFALFSAKFYSNPEAVGLYHRYVSQLLERKNSVTGKLYRDDPTIMAWQLANEPRPGDGKQSQPNLPNYLDWIENTAKLIKSIAPQQLVSVGSEGIMGCLGMKDCFLAAHSDNGVDYATFHMWPKNWGWFDVGNAGETFGRVITRADHYIDEHIRLADQMTMPLVLEEFGLERDGGAFGPDSSISFRNQFFQFVYAKINDSVHNGGPLVGSNVWAWGGYGEALHEDAVWREGDKSFVGDPPQEPQGLNSVFATDLSTLEIFKTHNEIINAGL